MGSRITLDVADGIVTMARPPKVRLGVVSGWGGTLRLPRLVRAFLDKRPARFRGR